VFKAGESQGKSGSFFFFSHDNEFIIKTMTEDELQVFLKALPDYFKHLQNNKSSLIARIYGVFKVQMEDLVPVNLMLMANTVRHGSSKSIANIFDLKGSIINRSVRITEKTKNTSTLKDVNLQLIKKQR
jgi:1-phosphatidylinositol-4-phosphate 5-kinase